MAITVPRCSKTHPHSLQSKLNPLYGFKPPFETFRCLLEEPITAVIIPQLDE
jgi:hypothetical protein